MPTFHIKPTLGRVVVQPVLTEEMSEGGIYMPHGKEQSGTVMEVVQVCDPYFSGRGDKDESPAGPQFAIGDYIIVGKYFGVDVEIGRSKYIIIKESDVLGTFIQEQPSAPTQSEPDKSSPSLPATGDTGPDRAAGFIDPIASGLADSE